MEINTVINAYHVVPDRNERAWDVEIAGQPFHIYEAQTQLEAMAFGVQQARASQGLLVVHGENGQFRDVRNYHNG